MFSNIWYLILWCVLFNIGIIVDRIFTTWWSIGLAWVLTYLYILLMFHLGKIDNDIIAVCLKRKLKIKEAQNERH